jgi:large subunit ribosomal protein L25
MGGRMSLSLSARPRTTRGRHLGALRREGHIPAVVYGHDYPSLAIETDLRELERLWHRAGRTQLVDLAVEGRRTRKVLIRELQFNPRSGRAIHADFFAINLAEKTTADVPVVLVGEAPAEVTKLGHVLLVATTVRVEALPADLPGQIIADISGLDHVDAGITAGELVLPDGVVLLVDPTDVIAKISARRVRGTAEEDEAAEAAEAEAAAAESAGAAEAAAEPEAEA